MDLQQQELDDFEVGLFKIVFGENYESNNLYKLATITYGSKINAYISEFEALIRPLMTDSGMINGEKLKQVVELKYPQHSNLIPSTNFRLVALLDIIKSIKTN